MTNPNVQSTPSIKEMIQARVELLHSLGRPAVDMWDALDRPIPVPTEEEMRMQLSERRAQPGVVTSPVEPTPSNLQASLPKVNHGTEHAYFA